MKINKGKYRAPEKQTILDVRAEGVNRSLISKTYNRGRIGEVPIEAMKLYLKGYIYHEKTGETGSHKRNFYIKDYPAENDSANNTHSNDTSLHIDYAPQYYILKPEHKIHAYVFPVEVTTSKKGETHIKIDCIEFQNIDSENELYVFPRNCDSYICFTRLLFSDKRIKALKQQLLNELTGKGHCYRLDKIDWNLRLHRPQRKDDTIDIALPRQAQPELDREATNIEIIDGVTYQYHQIFLPEYTTTAYYLFDIWKPAQEDFYTQEEEWGKKRYIFEVVNRVKEQYKGSIDLEKMYEVEDSLNALYNIRPMKQRKNRLMRLLNWLSLKKYDEACIDYLYPQPGQDDLLNEEKSRYKEIMDLLETTPAGQKYKRKKVSESIDLKSRLHNEKINRYDIEQYYKEYPKGSFVFFLRNVAGHDSIYSPCADIIATYAMHIYKEEKKILMNSAHLKDVYKKYDTVPVNISKSLNKELDAIRNAVTKKVLVDIKTTYGLQYKTVKLKVRPYSPKLKKISDALIKKIPESMRAGILQVKEKTPKVYALVQQDCSLSGKDVNIVQRLKKSKILAMQTSLSVLNLGFTIEQLYSNENYAKQGKGLQLGIDVVNVIQGTTQLYAETINLLDLTKESGKLKFFRTTGRYVGRFSGFLTVALDLYTAYDSWEDGNTGKFVGALMSASGGLIFLLIVCGYLTGGLTTAAAFILTATGVITQIAFEREWMEEWVAHCYLGDRCNEDADDYPSWGDEKPVFDEWKNNYQVQINELHELIESSNK